MWLNNREAAGIIPVPESSVNTMVFREAPFVIDICH